MITKKIFRVKVQSILRKTHLLKTVERLRYYRKLVSYRGKNRRFVNDNPGFALPPEHLAFDAYSSPHWEFYKVSGEITAKFLAIITAKYFSNSHPLKTVYDWGCGPARIIRQLRMVLDSSVELYGSDYNPETIEWCQNNIPGIHFTTNNIQPPLSYESNKFDFIYAASVFTHLSEPNALLWIDELYRVLDPNGILLITSVSGRAYENELLKEERKKYDEEGIVVRANYEEGKKMFLAVHSPRYIREKLLHQFEVLEHMPSMFPFMKQDYWVVRKRK